MITLMSGTPRSGISIHALREESDRSIIKLLGLDNLISIHALREESDLLRLS